jgi:hypothetical protein
VTLVLRNHGDTGERVRQCCRCLRGLKADMRWYQQLPHAPLYFLGMDTTSMESEIDATRSRLLSECLLTLQVTFASEMLSWFRGSIGVVGWSWYWRAW